MNTKLLLATLAAGVASFLMGWLVYGMALKGYMHDHTTAKALLTMKPEPNLVYLFAGSLATGLWMSWALSRMSVATAMGGFMAGLILSGLIGLGYDLMFYGLMDMYKGRMALGVDVIAGAVCGGVTGAVAGIVLGMGGKSTA
ncbi:MAG TPA: hypothetical protein VKG92_02905 [Flavobacteriales bacterium]|nr:hypothetical protein [Flavobacteriales bacterium]